MSNKSSTNIHKFDRVSLRLTSQYQEPKTSAIADGDINLQYKIKTMQQGSPLIMQLLHFSLFSSRVSTSLKYYLEIRKFKTSVNSF